MNREIKFRAWDKKNKKMRFVVGMTFYDDGGNFDDVEIDSVAFEGMEGKDLQNWRTDQYSELMQYTGLKDKNGKEIYEGDILIDDEYPEEGIGYAKVEWENAGWIADPWFGTEEFAEEAKDYEVIGNIHENPYYQF